MKRKTVIRIAAAMCIWGFVGGWRIISDLTGWPLTTADRDWTLLVCGLTLMLALNQNEN